MNRFFRRVAQCSAFPARILFSALTLTLSTMLVPVSDARAGVVPPPWATSDPTSPQTQQLWTFNNPAAPTIPDFVNNPNGNPTFNPTNAQYLPTGPFGNSSGGYGLPGTTPLNFVIPNYNQQFRKEIWVVIKFFLPPTGGGVPTVNILGLDGSLGVQINTPTPSPVPGGPQGLVEIGYLFSMPTCWTFEMSITAPNIPGALGFIDQVYVATRCIIPAPGTGALLALSGITLASRRRRSAPL